MAVGSRWRLAWGLALVAGLALQVVLWLRSIWIYLDQVELYRLGMAWARDRQFLPIGKLSTGDFPVPGVFLQLLVGWPLELWADVRSSTLVLILFHTAAALVVSRVLARDFDWRVATVYMLVFWLSPWRLFHAGFLWETNYLVLPAAIHFAACRASRDAAHFGASVLLSLCLMLTLQLHASVLILFMSCALLLWWGRLHVDWRGLLVGALAGSVTLLPSILALLRGELSDLHPEPMAGVLTRLNSVEKGLLYWFRLGSLDVGRRYRQSLFCVEPGGGDVAPAPWLCRLDELTESLALASVVISVAAGWWLWRRSGRRGSVDRASAATDWYRRYTLSMLGAVLIAALLSPVLLQGWHVLIALVAACLPVALWIAQRWPVAGTPLRTVLLAYLVWHLPASLLLLGHPMYAAPESPELPRHIAPADLRDLVPDR